MQGGLVKLPKLTDAECWLLFDNDGCLKCHCFFAGHKSSNCPNAWLNATKYRTLTQADVDRTKNRGATRPIAAIVADENHSAAPSHPVAVVLGSSNAPTAYMPSNASNVIEGSDASNSDLSVSDDASPPPPKELTTEYPHFWWRCLVEGNSSPSPVEDRALMDNGSQKVLIDMHLVDSLQLKRRKLYKPESFCLAITSFALQ
jgi:hypothetical protein